MQPQPWLSQLHVAPVPQPPSVEPAPPSGLHGESVQKCVVLSPMIEQIFAFGVEVQSSKV